MKSEKRGAALLTALGLLLVFSMLGTAYVAYMASELAESEFDTRALQVRYFARGGVNAAIGELQAGRAADIIGKGLKLQYPVYRRDRLNPSGFAPRETAEGTVQVTVTDDTAKIAPGQAPEQMLRAILGTGAAEQVPPGADGRRCYRIVSEASMPGPWPPIRGRAEALVILGADGPPEICLWSEARTGED